MNIAIHHSHGNPQVLLRKDELLVHGPLLIRWELDHAQLGFEGRRVGVPVELGLRRVRLRELLHLVECVLMELQG